MSKPRGADHRVHAGSPCRAASVAQHRIGLREVNDDVRPSWAPASASCELRPERGIDARHELHVGRAADGLLGRLPHAPGGAGDDYPDQRAQRYSARARARPAQRRRRRRRPASSSSGTSALRKSSSSEPMPATDRRIAGEELARERAAVLGADRVDALHELVDREDRQSPEQRGAEAAHARPA